MKRKLILVTGWCVLAARAFAADRAPDLSRLFPQETDVFVERAGVSRIVLPPAVLRSCRPDLADVRIFDRDGRQVPFVTDSGVGQNEVRESRVSRRAQIVDVRRDSATGEERYDLAAPEAPPAGGGWQLVVDTAQREFERTIEITGRRGDGVVVPVLPQTSLFSLPRLGAEQRAFTLPAVVIDRLTVTIGGGAEGFLNPSFSFESVHRIETAARVSVPLEELGHESSEGTTRFELVRPRGIAPDVIRLETTTPAFSRAVRVVDVQPTGSEVGLGSANLFRVPSQPPIEERDVHVNPARGDRLRIEVRDQDSPTLEGVRFVAVVQQPVLIVSLSPGADGGPAATLRFGGGRAGPPRYDLAALLAPGSRLSGDPARIATWLYDPAELNEARLGDLRANAAFDRSPALAFAMHASDEIDVAVFAQRRGLAVNPSPEGLSRLRLSAADMAAARPDLADVRVVDASAHQWPYLLERDAGSEWVELISSPPSRRDHSSRYALGLPVPRLRVDQVLIDIDAPYFHRRFRLVTTTAEGEEQILAQGDLTRAVGSSGPVTVAMQPASVQRLALVVEDGDDAPLVVRGVRARRPATDLYLAAPAGTYFLLEGHPDAQPPRYELAAVRDVVLAVTSAPIEAGALESNPWYSLRARLGTQAKIRRLQQIGVWVVLAGAVLVLSVMTLRLVRRE